MKSRYWERLQWCILVVVWTLLIVKFFELILGGAN